MADPGRPAGGEYACPLCSFVGRSPELVTGHVNTVHSSPVPPAPPDGLRAAAAEKSNLKRARISDSPGTDEPVPCPVCCRRFSDPNLLARHVESHFNGEDSAVSSSQSPAAGVPSNRTAAVVSKSVDDVSGESSLVACPYAGCSETVHASMYRDHLTAHAVMDEEDRQQQQLSEMRAAQEQKSLGELQGQYGFDSSSGGYADQYGRTLDRSADHQQMSGLEHHHQRALLAERMACGIDGNDTATHGLIESIQDIYRGSKMRTLTFASLCSPATHYSADRGDSGWGCGYRNLQMMMSSLLRLPQYRDRLLQVLPAVAEDQVPSIPKLQELIEAGWHAGFDVAGAEQLGHSVVGSRKWIGASDVTAVLRYCGIRARLVDFHHHTGPDRTHPAMLDWVKDYFRKGIATGGGNTSNRATGGSSMPMSSSSSSSSSAVKPQQPTMRLSSAELVRVHCDKFPLYFQHQGHSRTVVGVEERQGRNISLLIFDPSQPPRKMATLLPRKTSASASSSSARITSSASFPPSGGTTGSAGSAGHRTGGAQNALGSISNVVNGDSRSGPGQAGPPASSASAASWDGGRGSVAVPAASSAQPADASTLQVIRRPKGQLQSQQYQAVFVDGLISPAERESMKILYSQRVPS